MPKTQREDRVDEKTMSSGREGRRRKGGIEVARAIAAKNLLAGAKVLHRKTRRVKFDGTIIISSKLANRNEIFNELWSYKSISKVERCVRKHGMTNTTNRKKRTITDDNMLRSYAARIKNST